MHEREINIDKYGPIEHVSIPIPEGGGVTVLRGYNGSGKSMALGAVDALVRGTTPAGEPKRGGDEFSRIAEIEGLGRRIRVSMQRATTSGHLEVGEIDGDVSLGALIDGDRLKDKRAADRRRIRAALTMARAEPDFRAFAELVGGVAQAQRYASEKTLAAVDMPDMAAAFRSDLQLAARNVEGEATKARAVATAQQMALGEVDLDSLRSCVTADTAAQALGEAIAGLQSAKAAAATYERILASATSARSILDSLDGASLKCATLPGEIEEVIEQIGEAQRHLAALHAKRSMLQAELEAAEKSTKVIESAQKSLVDLEKCPRVTDADVEMARAKVEAARAQHAEAVDVAAKLDAAAVAVASAARAEQLETEAARLRQAAAGTDAVLAEALAKIAPPGLTVFDGMLIWERASGERVPMHELSDGERARIGIQIAVAAHASGCVLVVDQPCWEGLDAAARADVIAASKEFRVNIVTAEADRELVGDLRTEVVQ